MKTKTLLLLTLLSAAVYAQVPIKGSKVDATQGYTVNGAAPNNQTLCGNGTAFVPGSSCAIAASTSTSLDHTPTQCPSGQTAQGIAANGNAQGCTGTGAVTGNSTDPGYIQFSNGLIMEWATGTTDAGSAGTVTQVVNLPLTCPTGILSVQVTTNFFSFVSTNDDIMMYTIDRSGAGPTTSAIPLIRLRRGDDGGVNTSPTVWVICH